MYNVNEENLKILGLSGIDLQDCLWDICIDEDEFILE